MLSIGRMASGQGKYYLDLAREDYYLEGGEPPGKWHGRGADALRLSGTVKRVHLERLFAGYGPDQTPLVQNAGRKGRRPGFDLTFSAPKSVSVLWSQADQDVRRVIQQAHAAAVAAALNYLEAEAGFTRRGRGGTELVRASLIFATFEHGTSRALDPQLHTHALALNVAVGADGRFGTLEGHALYEHKMAAGVLYRSELAHQLRMTLGLPLYAGETSFEIEGVIDAVMEFFSKRRAEIEKELEARGLESATAAAFATLATREVKELVPPREKLFADWREIGRSLGFVASHVLALAREPGPAPTPDLARLVHEAAEKITKQESHFAERDVLRDVAQEVQALGLSAKTLHETVKTVLAESPEIVRLGERDGYVRYTTKATFELEEKMIEAADRLHADQSRYVSGKIVESIVATPRTIKTREGDKEITLTFEQAEAVRGLTRQSRGGRIRILEGLAGTTKTTTLAAVREAWEKSGHQVIGVALAAKAAKELKKGAGIEHSMTIAMLEKKMSLAAAKPKKPTLRETLAHEATQLGRAIIGKERRSQRRPLDKSKMGSLGSTLAHEAKQFGRAIVGKGRHKQLKPVYQWRKRTFVDTLGHELTQLGRAIVGKKRIRQGDFVPVKNARPNPVPLNDKTVLVVDEAGMVGTAQLARLVTAAEKAGAVIILAGDRRQLQPIEAGGPFPYLADRFGHAELKTITRQRDEQDKKNVHAFAEGKAATALEDLAKRGLLTVKQSRAAAIDDLVTEWAKNETKKPEGSLIFCGTNAEADQINRKCQEARLADGTIDRRERLQFKDGELFVGDRVLFTENSRPLGVNNGETGTIVAVNRRTSSIAVTLDDGDRRVIPLRDYKNVRLGYAVTTHKGQGTTVENAYVLAGGFMQDREISYVQASRARGTTRVFTDRNEAGQKLENLARQMSKSRTKELAHELLSQDRMRERSR